MTEIVARPHFVLADTSLKMLHHVIQGAMGWFDGLMPWKRP